MSRISQIDRNTTTPERKQLLDQIHNAFGATPHMFSTVAHSPAALKSMWGSFGALGFALAIVEQRGQLPDADLRAVRAAGFDDEAIVEIVAHVALNLFTNYVNIVFAVPVDFPAVALVPAKETA